MDVLKVLYRASRLEELIAENMEDLGKLHISKGNLPSSTVGSGAGTSSESSAAYTKAMEQIEKLEEKILNQNAEYAETLSTILLLINKVEDIEIRLILQKKLFSRKTYEVVAKEVGYDERTIKRKYSDGLEELKRIYKDVPKCP
jgi:hypothetical protein